MTKVWDKKWQVQSIICLQKFFSSEEEEQKKLYAPTLPSLPFFLL
jgi:hypothetical protein